MKISHKIFITLSIICFSGEQYFYNIFPLSMISCFLHTLSHEHSIKTDRACDKNQSISYILPFYSVFHYSCLGTLDCCQVLLTVHSNFSNVYIFFIFKFLLKNFFYSEKYTRNMIVANKYSEYYNPVLWLFSFDIVPI